jgi:hypothetical protein
VSLYVVIGPPAGGKSTWVQRQAGPMDIVIDYDLLATALSGPGTDGHAHGPEVKTVTKAARATAIEVAERQADKVDVYVIHSNPSWERLRHYASIGAQVVTIDPGRDVVLSRVKRERPKLMFRVVEEWYATHSPTGASPPAVRGRSASRAW